MLAPFPPKPLPVQPAEKAFEAERQVRRHATLVARQRQEQRVGFVLVEGPMQRPADMDRLAEPRAEALEQCGGWRCERHATLAQLASHPVMTTARGVVNATPHLAHRLSEAAAATRNVASGHCGRRTVQCTKGPTKARADRGHAHPRGARCARSDPRPVPWQLHAEISPSRTKAMISSPRDVS